jgi:hypothetical protein
MQTWVLLALALLTFVPVEQSITLEVRTFDGAAEVSDATRVVVHRAAQRNQPVGQISPGTRPAIKVQPGIYDAQAIREQAGGLADIRWAERLIVMPYPDENGYHLEVINFQTGYGALEVRDSTGRGLEAEVALYTSADRGKPVAQPITTSRYALFVVKTGEYDLLVRRGELSAWHPRIDVPAGRTRLLIVP